MDIGHGGSFDRACAGRSCDFDNSCSVEIDARRQQLIDVIDALPEAVSAVGGDAWQDVGFTVRKKRFAWYLDDHGG